MALSHSTILRFTPPAQAGKAATISVNEIPLWSITRSYYEMEQHTDDAHYKTLSRRLGMDMQTTRRWVTGEWSVVMLQSVDRSDVLDQLATNRSYKSIADELLVDELALRKWVKRDQDALRTAEEYKAEMQIDQAKDWIKSASRPEESKAAASLLTHAQWSAERLYRTKFKPNAETAILPMSFNFDLGQNVVPERILPSGQPEPITIEHNPGPGVQGRPDALQAVRNEQADHSDYGASGFRENFTYGDVAP